MNCTKMMYAATASAMTTAELGSRDGPELPYISSRNIPNMSGQNTCVGPMTNASFQFHVPTSAHPTAVNPEKPPMMSHPASVGGLAISLTMSTPIGANRQKTPV